MEEAYVFRHPRIKMRRESFGGLVQSDGLLYILGREEFSALSTFCGYAPKETTEGKLGEALLEKFLAANLLLSVGKEEAKIILKEKKGGEKDGRQCLVAV